jgi:hypothetical protein
MRVRDELRIKRFGGLGLRQVPPMDLGQVEVVKGVAL